MFLLSYCLCFCCTRSRLHPPRGNPIFTTIADVNLPATSSSFKAKTIDCNWRFPPASPQLALTKKLPPASFFCSRSSRLHETMWCGSSRVHHATRRLHGTILTCLPSNTVTTTLHSWWGFTYPPCDTLQCRLLQRGAVLECPPHNTPTLTTSLAARFLRVRRQHAPTSSTITCSAVLTCPLHNTPLDSPLNNLFRGAVLTCPPPTRHFQHG